MSNIFNIKFIFIFILHLIIDLYLDLDLIIGLYISISKEKPYLTNRGCLYIFFLIKKKIKHDRCVIV